MNQIDPKSWFNCSWEEGAEECVMKLWEPGCLSELPAGTHLLPGTLTPGSRWIRMLSITFTWSSPEGQVPAAGGGGPDWGEGQPLVFPWTMPLEPCDLHTCKPYAWGSLPRVLWTFQSN